MSFSWIAVASAEHVRRGRADGFMQVCHGRPAPLRRVRPGNRVAYYSPTATFRSGDRLQAFTAIGIVRDREPYAVDMGNGFRPFRRDVAWMAAEQTPIAALIDALEFTSKRNWGYQLRLGLIAVSERDMDLIAAAMRVRLAAA